MPNAPTLSIDASAKIGALAVPATGLTEEHFSVAEDYLKESGLWDACEGALISGSLADGAGHPASDLDIYLFVEEEIEDATPYPRINGLRLDVEQIPIAEFEKFAARYSTFWATSTDRDQVHLRLDQLKLLVRVFLGQVLKDSPTVSRIRGKIDARALRQVIMTRWMLHTGSLVEDTYGALAMGDLLTAHLASSIALDTMCDALLAACGDVNGSDKLRLRRLARAPQLRSFLEHYWRVQYLDMPRGTDRDEFVALVNERLWTVNAMSAACALDYWEEPPAGEVELSLVANSEGGGPVRNPFSGAVRFTDELGLTKPNVAFEFSDMALRIWSLLDGRPLEAVVADMAARLGATVDEIDSDVREAVQMMADAELITI